MSTFVRRPIVIGAALLALFVIPFVIAAVNLAHPRPYVVLDWAQTEMRVRSVFTLHPPLIGLPGRIGTFGVNTGSHPGPISFYLLAPVYWLFGRTPWSLFASALTMNLAWIAVGMWLAFRRAGRAGLVVFGVGMLALIHGYGMVVVDQPWNPYMPLMMWPVVLLAAWSVLLEDAPILPVLVAAATFCMQTHLPYLGLAGGLTGAAVVGMIVLVWFRTRAARAASPDDPGASSEASAEVDGAPPDIRRLVRWGLIAVAVGVVLWLPPVADQIRHSPGNMRLIVHDLQHPPEAAGGLSQGVRLLLVHLNPVELLRGHVSQSIVVHSRLPGAVFGLVWLASVGVAAWLRARRLLLLDAVLGVALLLGLVSLSKIYGDLLWYLMLWAWALCGLMLVTVVWTAVEAWRRTSSDDAWTAATRGGAVLASVAAVLLCVGLSVDATKVEVPLQQSSIQMSHIIPATIRAVQDGKVPGDTGHGRYIVTWTDPINIGSTGYTVLDEFDRHGIPAGVQPNLRGIVRDDELIPPGDERGVVHVAVGQDDIDLWRAKPGVVEVIRYDGRSPAQVKEYARLRAEAMRLIEAAGGDPTKVDRSVVGASIDSNVPRAARTDLSRMSNIGLPIAVFLAAPGNR